MSELPGDLVEEILSRVPATSLKRLRSTCKRWNNLFNHRRFARKHLDKAAKQFMILMSIKFKVCFMNVNFHGIPHVEVRSELSQINLIDQVEISKVFHCDGLLLCVTKEENTRLVIWNPCTGQTKWIGPLSRSTRFDTYTLGSYQENKSQYNSYKILRYRWNNGEKKKFEIYEINSNLWRTLDITLDHDVYISCCVSLKGKTYWSALHLKAAGFHDIFLISFDYTTERLERICLPYRHTRYPTVCLSVVREEKLSVLILGGSTHKTVIWVINKIGETKVVSWSMVLAVDLRSEHMVIYNLVSFFLNEEEKKVLLCCDNSLCKGRTTVYIIEEENKVRPTEFEVSSPPIWFSYVPSLTQF